MGIAAKHLPVFVAGDKRDLFDRETRFEEAACAFVPEVVKVEVFDFEFAALTPKRRSYGSSVVWENPAATLADTATLLLDDRARVVARDVK
jgi:hypothetical protein